MDYGIILFDEKYNGYIFSHDIFETIVIEKLISQILLKSKDDFYTELGSSHLVMRTSREFFKRRIIEIDNEISDFIVNSFYNINVSDVWQKELLTAILSSENLTDSIIKLLNKLLDDNRYDLHEMLNILNTSCKNINDEKYTPYGVGWNYIISFINKNVNSINFIDNIDILSELLYDYMEHNNKNCKELALIALHIYSNYEKGNEKICKILLLNANELINELPIIFEEAITQPISSGLEKNKHQMICDLLINKSDYCYPFCNLNSELLIKVAKYFWVNEKSNMELTTDFTITINEESCLLTFLQKNTNDALDFIIWFVNRFSEINETAVKSNRIIINLPNGERSEQISNNIYYRVEFTQVPTIILKSLLAFKTWLKEYIENHDTFISEKMCLDILLKMRTVMITVRIIELINLFPDKLENVADVLKKSFNTEDLNELISKDFMNQIFNSSDFSDLDLWSTLKLHSDESKGFERYDDIKNVLIDLEDYWNQFNNNNRITHKYFITCMPLTATHVLLSIFENEITDLDLLKNILFTYTMYVMDDFQFQKMPYKINSIIFLNWIRIAIRENNKNVLTNAELLVLAMFLDTDDNEDDATYRPLFYHQVWNIDEYIAEKFLSFLISIVARFNILEFSHLKKSEDFNLKNYVEELLENVKVIMIDESLFHESLNEIISKKVYDYLPDKIKLEKSLLDLMLISLMLNPNKNRYTDIIITKSDYLWENVFSYFDTRTNCFLSVSIENDYFLWLSAYLYNISSEEVCLIIDKISKLLKKPTAELCLFLATLVKQFTFTNDVEKFWLIWHLLLDTLTDIINNKIEGYEYFTQIYVQPPLYSVALKNENINSFQARTIKFYFDIANKIFDIKLILHEFALIIVDFNDSSLDDEIIRFLCYCIDKFDSLANNEETIINIDNIELFVQRILTQENDLKKSKYFKEIIKILDFLISIGSEEAYRLKEDI